MKNLNKKFLTASIVFTLTGNIYTGSQATLAMEEVETDNKTNKDKTDEKVSNYYKSIFEKRKRIAEAKKTKKTVKEKGNNKIQKNDYVEKEENLKFKEKLKEVGLDPDNELDKNIVNILCQRSIYPYGKKISIKDGKINKEYSKTKKIYIKNNNLYIEDVNGESTSNKAIVTEEFKKAIESLKNIDLSIKNSENKEIIEILASNKISCFNMDSLASDESSLNAIDESSCSNTSSLAVLDELNCSNIDGLASDESSCSSTSSLAVLDELNCSNIGNDDHVTFTKNNDFYLADAHLLGTDDYIFLPFSKDHGFYEFCKNIPLCRFGLDKEAGSLEMIKVKNNKNNDDKNIKDSKNNAKSCDINNLNESETFTAILSNTNRNLYYSTEELENYIEKLATNLAKLDLNDIFNSILKKFGANEKNKKNFQETLVSGYSDSAGNYYKVYLDENKEPIVFCRNNNAYSNSEIVRAFIEAVYVEWRLSYYSEEAQLSPQTHHTINEASRLFIGADINENRNIRDSSCCCKCLIF